MTPDRAIERWQARIGDGGKAVPSGTPSNQPPTAADGSSPLAAANLSGTQTARKSVLLVDSHPESRETRAKAMRFLGARVETASGPQDARVRLTTEHYDLVLVEVGRNLAAARSLGDEIKARNPRQRIGYLVGSPRFITTSLGAAPARSNRALAPDTVAPAATLPAVNASTDFGQRIREAEAEAYPDQPA